MKSVYLFFVSANSITNPYSHTARNVSPVNVVPEVRLLVFNIQTPQNVRVSQYNVFSADVYLRTIYTNVPKTQYNISNKTMCTQAVRTLHVTAYTATV
jgi:hypothetical protein